MPTSLAGFCPQCGAEAVGLVTTGGEISAVWWCERGHVVVLDSGEGALKAIQLVYDFHHDGVDSL